MEAAPKPGGRLRHRRINREARSTPGHAVGQCPGWAGQSPQKARSRQVARCHRAWQRGRQPRGRRNNPGRRGLQPRQTSRVPGRATGHPPIGTPPSPQRRFRPAFAKPVRSFPCSNPHKLSWLSEPVPPGARRTVHRPPQAEESRGNRRAAPGTQTGRAQGSVRMQSIPKRGTIEPACRIPIPSRSCRNPGDQWNQRRHQRHVRENPGGDPADTGLERIYEAEHQAARRGAGGSRSNLRSECGPGNC